MDRRRISLAALLGAFGSIGLTSFGGGRLAHFRHVVVVRRRWLTDEQFLDGMTLSQILPGPNVSNISVYLGQRLRGPLGALLAWSAVVLPGAFMILLLGVLYFKHGNLPQAPAVFKGVGAAAVGLALTTTLQVGRRGIRGRQDLLIMTLTFVAVAFLHLSLVVALLSFAPLSVWLNRPRPVIGEPLPPAPEESTP